MNELSKREKLEACYTITKDKITWKGLDCTGYRLPTDAEWEYAGRGGVAEPIYGPMDDIAWHFDNSNTTGSATRQPVGKKQANAYGLYDMMGNASEMTWDEYKETAFEKDSTDPIIGGLEVKDVSLQRTVRGSSFVSAPSYATIAARYEAPPTGADWVGFRPVRTVKK
ncbi:MAG: formylglycine-generating enzyme family protein [Kofleriaceae bacterium]